MMTVVAGDKFGRWSVLFGAATKNKKLRFTCQCECGTVRELEKYSLTSGNSTSCRCKQIDRNRANTREKSPTWKGGRHIDENGYVMIYIPEHPRSKKNGYIREHTVVMEKVLGRYLAKEENVHHKNGLRDDNSTENLELWSKSQPWGQRVSDKVEWAKQILKRYEPECLNHY